MKFWPLTRNNKYLGIFSVTIMLTVAAGWQLTGFLGRVAEKEFEAKVDREALLTVSLLNGNLGDAASAAKSLSSAEAIGAALSTRSAADLEGANRLLDRINSSFDMAVCYLLDRNGLAIASSNRNEKISYIGKSFAARPFFTGALAGRLTEHFALGVYTGERGYFVATPVVSSAGSITGVVVVKRNVTPVEKFLKKYNHAFLVSPEGIIFIASSEGLLYRSLWPIDETGRAKLLASTQFGTINFEPLLAAEPHTGSYVSFAGNEHYLQRLPFGNDGCDCGWTLVLMEESDVVANYRLFGILLTAVFVLLLLFFYSILLYKNRSLETARNLLKARDDWKRTFDTVPDLIATIDANHRIINMNRAMAERLGISQNEAAGRRCCELVHGSQEPPPSCPHRRSFFSGRTEAETLFELNLNGDYIVTASPLLAEDGTVESTVHVMHDISKLKQVETELRESRQQSLDIIQFYPDATMVIDSGGKVVAWNHAMEEITGVPSEDMLGRGEYEYALPFYGERRPILIDLIMEPDGELEKKYTQVVRRGDTLVGEAYMKNMRGEECYLHGTASPLHNSAGEIIGAIESIRDITERKRMEEDLKKSRVAAEEYAQRLEFVLEGSNDATWEWDIIADQGVINTKYYEMTGYTPGEVDLNFAFFMGTIHPDDVSEVQMCMQEHLEGKFGGYEAHYRMVTKSGKLRHVMMRGKIVRHDEDGRPTWMAGVVTDVTEMKRLSDEVNRTCNLASIGLLAGGLAHDFNNVLNIIYGNISFAKMLAGDNAAIIEPLTDSEEACERARELGIRLQALSLGSSLPKEPIALQAIIEDAAGKLFKGSNISHAISAPDDLLSVEADPRQIRQVFENLLFNAKEAMSEDGIVMIDIENFEADGKNEKLLGAGTYVCIALQDNGKGIPEENLPKIFNPYFSTKDTYSQKGLGLGLSICQAILKRHGGHISVESTMGIGTRFAIYLPASVGETGFTSER